jgi:hypothetical protein
VSNKKTTVTISESTLIELYRLKRAVNARNYDELIKRLIRAYVRSRRAAEKAVR